MWPALALALVQVVAVAPFSEVGAHADATTTPLAAGLRQVIADDLGGVAGVRIGDQGARLRISGSYRRSATELALTARIFRKSGRLAATVTASGAPEELLLLASRVESRVLRLLGAPRAAIEQVTYREHPHLRTVRVVERFGAALQAQDLEVRQHLLEQALDDDPTFVYASRALDALARALPPRDPIEHAFQTRAEKQALARWRAQLVAVKDPARLAGEQLSRFLSLQKERRFRQLLAEAKAVLALEPPAVPSLSEQLPESAEYLMVAAYDQLNDDDSLLREGQRYLARYPASNGFVVVRQLVDGAIARQKEREAGRATLAAALAKLGPSERADPCRVAALDFDHHQLAEAEASYRACLVRRTLPDALVRLTWTEYRLGHFSEVVHLLERIRQQAPERYRQVMQLVDALPVD